MTAVSVDVETLAAASSAVAGAAEDIATAMVAARRAPAGSVERAHWVGEALEEAGVFEAADERLRGLIAGLVESGRAL